MAVSQNRLQLESKNDLTTTGLFSEILLEYSSSRRLDVCVD